MSLNIDGITLDSFIGIGGIALAILLYYFDLKKKLEDMQGKLDNVLHRSEGILTKQQAHDLIDLYLDAVDSHIELAVSRYAINDLSKHYDAGNFDAIKNEFVRAYDQIVKKSIRKMVSSFQLRGNHRVDHLIQTISQEHVGDAMSSIVKIFVEARAANLLLQDVIPKVLLLSREINAVGKTLIAAEVDKHYPSRAA